MKHRSGVQGSSFAAKLLLETVDGVAVALACQLDSPLDLLRLGMACKRFRLKTVARPLDHDDSVATAEAAAAPQMWSIVSEAARRWVAGRPDEQRRWVPRRASDCWLGLMHEVGLLCAPLVLFWHPSTHITLSEGGTVATRVTRYDGNTWYASSKAVMRSGRHRARFTVLRGHFQYYGVVRPTGSVDEGGRPQAVPGHRFFSVYDGSRYPGRERWEGAQGAREGDAITLDLDLDAGTMTVWKNGNRRRR
eukprot:COSAG01_NODE_5965_length_3929_cov_4.932898_2_plen_249_part_00